MGLTGQEPFNRVSKIAHGAERGSGVPLGLRQGNPNREIIPNFFQPKPEPGTLVSIGRLAP